VSNKRSRESFKCGKVLSMPLSSVELQGAQIQNQKDGAKWGPYVLVCSQLSDTLTTAKRVNTGSYCFVRLRDTLRNVLKIRWELGVSRSKEVAKLFAVALTRSTGNPQCVGVGMTISNQPPTDSDERC
jgi:hypothetical protein